MSTHDSELADPIYGSVDVNRNATNRVEAALSTNSDLVHVHIGPFYIAMSPSNWRAVLRTVGGVEIEVGPPTFRVTLGDPAVVS